MFSEDELPAENSLFCCAWQTWESSDMFQVLSWFDTFASRFNRKLVFVIEFIFQDSGLYSGESWDHKEEGWDPVTCPAPGQLLNPDNIIAFSTSLTWSKLYSSWQRLPACCLQ